MGKHASVQRAPSGEAPLPSHRAEQPFVAPGAREEWDAARRRATSLLVDGVLHDVRNPLNALAINLDVVVEKLKAQAPALAEACARNVVAMREQVRRADAVLRRYADFAAPRVGKGGSTDLSAALADAVELVAYEARRSHIGLEPKIEPGLRVAGVEAGTVRALALLSVYRALLRAPSGGQVRIALVRSGGFARLTVSDGNAGDVEPLPEALAALPGLCASAGGAFICRGGESELTVAAEP